MAVQCKEMTELLKIIEDQEIEAIEAIDGGLEFELATCNLKLLNKVGRRGVVVKVDHPCAQMDASGGVTAAFDAKWGQFVITPAFFTRLVYQGV
jgi:hypothetical protein